MKANVADKTMWQRVDCECIIRHDLLRMSTYTATYTATTTKGTAGGEQRLVPEERLYRWLQPQYA